MSWSFRSMHRMSRGRRLLALLIFLQVYLLGNFLMVKWFMLFVRWTGANWPIVSETLRHALTLDSWRSSRQSEYTSDMSLVKVLNWGKTTCLSAKPGISYSAFKFVLDYLRKLTCSWRLLEDYLLRFRYLFTRISRVNESYLLSL